MINNTLQASLINLMMAFYSNLGVEFRSSSAMSEFRSPMAMSVSLPEVDLLDSENTPQGPRAILSFGYMEALEIPQPGQSSECEDYNPQKVEYTHMMGRTNLNSSSIPILESPLQATSLQTSNRAFQFQKRAYSQRRVDPSCDACRERKVKCDATETTSCSECSSRVVKCQFTKETNRRLSSIKQVQDLEKQVVQLKLKLSSLENASHSNFGNSERITDWPNPSRPSQLGNLPYQIDNLTHEDSPVSDHDATTDNSNDSETPSAASDIETDWEGTTGGRDRICNEICRSSQGKRITNMKVRQLRRERLIKDPKNQRLIDTLMGDFYVIFRKVGTGFTSCAEGQVSASQDSQKETTPKTYVTSSKVTRTNCSIGGVEDDLIDEEEEEGDGRPPKRLRLLPKSHEDKLPGLKFACPYHQHNPQKYGIGNISFDTHYRSCAGPGFLSIARMKEHLYRRHRIPIRCNRCGITFKNQECLKAHARVLIPCDVQPEIPIEGVTEEVERQLKSRKKLSLNQSDEDRWKAVYHILFPNEEIPCPYYEHDGELAAFQKYSNRETPMVFLRMLENRASTNQLTQETRDELVDIVQECRIFVYRRYHQEKARKPSIASEKIDGTIPSSASNDSQSDNSNAEAHLLPQSDIEDPADYDPVDFESIFKGGYSPLSYSGFDDLDWVPQVRHQCFCYEPCSCLPLPGSKNPI